MGNAFVEASHVGNDAFKSNTTVGGGGGLEASCTIKIINRYSAVAHENPWCLL